MERILGVILFGGIALYTLRLIRDTWRAVASRGWPAAQGRVTKAWVETSRNSDGFTSSTPHVEYEYVVDGRNYQGKTVYFGLLRSSVRDTVERYAPGSAVQVFYNPANPSLACLEPGNHWVNLLGLAIILVVSAILLPLYLQHYWV